MKKLKKKKNSKVYSNKNSSSISVNIDSIGVVSQLRGKKLQKSWRHYVVKILLVFLVFFLPTQFGKHFFPVYSYLNGVRVDYLAPTLYFTDILILIIFILNIKSFFNFFKNKVIFIALALLFINVVLAKNQIVAGYRFMKIMEFLVVFNLGQQLLPIIKEKLLLSALMFSGLFQLILAGLQFVNKQSIQGFFYFFGERLFNLSTPGIAKASIRGVEFLRPYGTFSHPNSLAGFFVLLYFFVLIEKKFNKHFYLKNISLLIFSILIFISFSKVAIMTFLILNTFYYILNTKIICLPCKISRILIPIFVSLVFFIANTDPLTIDKRLDLVKNSLEIISKNPFFGVGLNNYIIAQSDVAPKYFLFFNQPVHNIYLLFIAESGLFVGGILIFFLWKPLFKIIRYNSYLLMAVLFTGFFDHYWLTLQQNFLLLALIYGSVSSSLFMSELSLRS